MSSLNRSTLPSVGAGRAALRLGLLLPAALLAGCGDSVASSGTRVLRDPLTFGRSSMPAAYQGEPYEAALDVRGGTGPYGVQLASGTLPKGLELKNLRLSGTPTETGSFKFTLQANDANLSSKVQEYTLNVSDLPPLKLALELPRAEIRGKTRIPLNIVAPRTARAARVTWELPAGTRVTRVQASATNAITKWNQKGQTFTMDIGFKETPPSGGQVALLHLEPSGPVTLNDKVFSFRVLDGNGKDLTAQPAAQRAIQATASGAATVSGAATASASATAPAVASGAAVSGATVDEGEDGAASGPAVAPLQAPTASQTQTAPVPVPAPGAKP